MKPIRAWGVIAALSTAVLGFLVWLFLGRSGVDVAFDLSWMPRLNAVLNALAAFLLSAGWWAIRSGRRALHMRLMISAFLSSALFFMGYAVYHYFHGDTPYQGVGSIRVVYFTILISHIALSVALVPMALGTLYLAASERFQTHKKLARFTLPIWLYVSITGVVVYLMLY